MTTQQSRIDPGWGEKLKGYAKIVVPIVVAIWLFNIAYEARGIAESNAAALRVLQVPQFELALVPGGPDRFAATFEKIVENVDSGENFDATQYLWSTFVVRNAGNRTANSVILTVTAAVPIDQLLIAPPGFRNEATIEYEEGTNTASLAFRRLNGDDEVLLFIGMSPQSFEKPYDSAAQRAWAKNFELYFEKVSVESDKAVATLYSHGYTMAPLPPSE